MSKRKPRNRIIIPTNRKIRKVNIQREITNIIKQLGVRQTLEKGLI